jgi:AraC-like DNA-binding protein
MFLKYITLFSGLNYLIFSAVLLLRKSPTKKANQVLGFLFGMLAVYSILVSFYYTALLNKHYWLLSYYAPFDLLILFSLGPCLLLYVKVLLGQPIRPSKLQIFIQILPYIPAITFIVYFLLQDTPTRLNLLIENFENGIWHTNLLNLLVYFQMIIYLIICSRTIKKQFKKSSKIIIKKTQIDVSWLRIYVHVNLGFMLFTAPLSFYLGNENTNLVIAQAAMVIQFIYLFIKSTWQTGMFPAESIYEIKSSEGMLKIADGIVDDYFKALTTFMEMNKPYLKENCSIQSVSEQTGISVHHLSNILNNRVGRNFSDFVNEYRINEAKTLLATVHPKSITLEAIGYECGFGSKSSFNKAFKKHTNFTPSEYRIATQNQKDKVV